MSPDNLQMAYTVIDLWALVLPTFVLIYLVAGIFSGYLRVTATRPWAVAGAASMVWLALRGFGVIA